MAGEASARGEHARELGIQARDRINADFNVDNLDTPPRASQKLIAATTLLRAMPAPSTPEARNLHREAQALIEQAAVQQAESSASRIRQQGSAWNDGGRKVSSPRSTQVVRPNPPTTQGARRPKTDSSTHAGKHETETLAMSSMLGGRAKRRLGRQ
jgi:murein DD-endopeptidase MepM/ murein hydrolase activator NlpD